MKISVWETGLPLGGRLSIRPHTLNHWVKAASPQPPWWACTFRGFPELTLPSFPLGAWWQDAWSLQVSPVLGPTKAAHCRESNVKGEAIVT